MGSSSYDYNTSYDFEDVDDHGSNTMRKHMKMMKDMDGFTSFMYTPPNVEEDGAEYEYYYEEYDADEEDEGWYVVLKDEILFRLEAVAVEAKEIWLDVVYFFRACYHEYQRRRTINNIVSHKKNPHYKTVMGSNGKMRNVSYLKYKFFRRSKYW